MSIFPRILTVDEEGNARIFDLLAFRVQATEMVDPKQNVEHQSGTMSQQLHYAIRTIESEFAAPDGTVMTKEDVSEVVVALQTIKAVVDRVETKMSAYSAEHNEKPRSR